MKLQESVAKLQSQINKLESIVNDGGDNDHVKGEVEKTNTILEDEDHEKLDVLFSELITLRQKISVNADFANYRDYKFVEMGRFDYTKEDCFQFHDFCTY